MSLYQNMNTGDTIEPVGKLSFRQAFGSPWLGLVFKPRSASDRLFTRHYLDLESGKSRYTIIESGLLAQLNVIPERNEHEAAFVLFSSS
jgi:hypothetical protein